MPTALGTIASGYKKPTAAPSGAYLSPAVGTASTPDPGPPPADCTFVFKIRGPNTAGTGGNMIANQFDTYGNLSWRLERYAPSGPIFWGTDPNGNFSNEVMSNVDFPAITGADEYGALTVQTGAGNQTLRGYTSTDGVAWTGWPPKTAAHLPPFDSTDVVRIGRSLFTAEWFDGRIYSVELRTGLDPAAGTVLWRFDASDHISGTTWTDPRGRMWTLTSAAAITHPPGTGPFPVIAATNSEIGTSLGAANAIPAPTGVVAGDLLVACCGMDFASSAVAITASTGWTQIANLLTGFAAGLTVFARIADGSGNDALSLSGTTQDYCATILRITGHGVTTVATDIKSAIVAGTHQADPPSLNAASSKKWLWLAINATETSTSDTIAAMPASYTQLVNLKSASSASSVALAVAQRNLETQTEDPGAFTHSTTGRNWVAATIAIPPSP